MANNRLAYLYKKNIDNTCTEDEYIEFCELAADEANAAELEKLADASWDEETLTHIITDSRADILFNQVMQKGKAQDAAVNKTWGVSWYKLAAVLFVMVCAAILLFRSGKKASQTSVVMTEVHAIKEHQLVKLADGSTVILNANSFLKYPKVFTAKTREVTLNGEGYFDIKHNTAQPFIVYTGKLKVTVLGTAFNVKAYNGQQSIEVTVTRGKVSVSDAKKVLGVITPDQQISFNTETQNAVQVAVKADKAIEWQSKDLFFDDMTMQEAVVTLQQHFNVKINFAGDAVKNCRFTGTFLHGEKLADILDVLCKFNNANYKTAGDGHIVISGPGCS